MAADYSGLSGPITWAEFRGPDIEGADSAIVPINRQIEGNPHPGGATLTDQQAADLDRGPLVRRASRPRNIPAAKSAGPWCLPRAERGVSD